MRDQVVWNAFDLRDRGSVVFTCWINDKHILQVFPQFRL